MVPSPEQPSDKPTAEEYFGKFHQTQGSTTHCADYSISMACHIYYDKKGRPSERCEAGKITEFLDRFFFLGYRFPSERGIAEGGATPGGVIAALLVLGVPFFFNPFGTLEGLEHALLEEKVILVSQGRLLDPKSGTWGHVMVVVGMDGDAFLILDPAQPAGSGVSRRDKRAFLNDWWFPPFHPCWVIG
jgi:hypothetical protein